MSEYTQLPLDLQSPKLCECGCGKPTPFTRGKYARFLPSHNLKIVHEARKAPIPPPNPSGLCMCGCGQKAPIAKNTSVRLGRKKGFPCCYVRNHDRCVTLESQIARFLSRIKKGATEDDCWDWLGTKVGTGYGQMYFNGHGQRATHISYELFVEPIPAGMWVLHRCDNPPCCNPKHLFLGSPADNNDDKMAKGRHRAIPRPGTSNAGSKLTEADVIEMRRLFDRGDCSQAELTRRYGLSRAQVCLIVRRKAWTHILPMTLEQGT